MKTNIYDEKFYKGQMGSSFRSAKFILEYLFNIYRPTSIIDFGCGAGTWLRAAYELNNSQGKYVGLDGDWGSKDQLMPNYIDFRKIDFSNNYTVEERFDMAMSLEVAEHIPETLAEPFVSKLTDASDIVLFSAAIPGQGGVNHINEQYQSYWNRLFKKSGYECFDIIRPAFWSDDRVGVAYRQNTLIYVDPTSPKYELFSRLNKANEEMLDLVHPIVLERCTNRVFSNIFLLKRLIKNIFRL